MVGRGIGDGEPCRWPEPARRVAGDWIRLRSRLLPYVLAEAGWAAGRGCRSPGRWS